MIGSRRFGNKSRRRPNEKIGGFLFEIVVREHLRTNHFPPIDPVFLDSALEAIRRTDSEDWDSMITLPNGISLSVSQIIEELHLKDFLGVGEKS